MLLSEQARKTGGNSKSSATYNDRDKKHHDKIIYYAQVYPNKLNIERETISFD
jgi:hypothetical protein